MDNAQPERAKGNIPVATEIMRTADQNEMNVGINVVYLIEVEVQKLTKSTVVDECF